MLAQGLLLDFEDRAWYPDEVEPEVSGKEAMIPLTPYHDWANRGPSTMRVWIPVVEEV